MDADWSSGPDSEEIIYEVVKTHGNRSAVACIRAALQGNHDVLRNLATSANATLLLIEDSINCVERAYGPGKFPTHTPSQAAAVVAYPEPEQIASGDTGPPNELYPTGDRDEPERGFDALFWPPLLWAARNHDAPTCALLLELGADPNYASPAGMTAILATMRGGLYDHQEAIAVINVVATDVTINYLSAQAAANIAAAPPNEFTLHAERLPIVSLCLTPDLDPQSTLLVAQALIDKGAIVPPELLPDLTPDWFPQPVIDLLSHTAAAAAASGQ